MAVPKKHHTKSKRDRRRMHIYIEKKSTAPCAKCGKEKLPHFACQNCGYYREKEVIDVLGKLTKKEKKKREKEITEQDKKEKTTLTPEALSRKQ